MRHEGHRKQIEKYGGEEGWKAHMREIASKGGQRKVKKGFALMDKARNIELARKGGKFKPGRKDGEGKN